jgi:hypothetical protein
MILRAWIVARDNQSDGPELFLTEKAAQENACLGVADAHIYPAVWGIAAGTLMEVGKRVARRCIELCSCYGHICEHCCAAKELLNDLGANDERHIHKAHYEGGKLTDECDQCGRDLRDPLHRRVDEQIKGDCCGHDSDCAVHNAPALPAGACDCRVGG